MTERLPPRAPGTPPEATCCDAQGLMGGALRGGKPGTNDPDGQFDSQDMPTTDGQMASNTSEEVVPPSADTDPGA